MTRHETTVSETILRWWISSSCPLSVYSPSLYSVNESMDYVTIVGVPCVTTVRLIDYLRSFCVGIVRTDTKGSLVRVMSWRNLPKVHVNFTFTVLSGTVFFFSVRVFWRHTHTQKEKDSWLLIEKQSGHHTSVTFAESDPLAQVILLR